MIGSHSWFPRRAARIVASLGGALMLAALPAVAQRARPTLRHSNPVVNPNRQHTRVTLDYSLPRGFQITARPRVRVVRANGDLITLINTYFTPGAPLSQAFQDLNTAAYPPGTYQMRVEIDVSGPQGERETVTTPWAPLVVPKR
jgi:hypothetical protein